jgi:CheY-like chemotaxis protein
MTKRALVVEDDPHVMEYIEETMCSLDHEHVWATNQQDARQNLRSGKFDYVLLDLQIPATSTRDMASTEFGITLLREIKAHSGGATPVIITTSHPAALRDYQPKTQTTVPHADQSGEGENRPDGCRM